MQSDQIQNNLLTDRHSSHRIDHPKDRSTENDRDLHPKQQERDRETNYSVNGRRDQSQPGVPVEDGVQDSNRIPLATND
jgi:hypothetical protein